MVDEQRRYNWMDKAERPPLYDYVQARIKEKNLEDKYMGLILNENESMELKRAIREKERLTVSSDVTTEAGSKSNFANMTVNQ